VVIVDPISSFTGASFDEVNSMVMRLIDYLKSKEITAVFTHLILAAAHHRRWKSGCRR
jgi:circadian clock protein KaiC